VVAAESLAERLGPGHRITLVSRHRVFTFFPALVRLAFGRCAPDDVSYDLEEAMLSRRVEFLRAEVVSIDPDARHVLGLQGKREIRLPYDYLIFALGRRLAVERIPGFSLHAHHPLTVASALRFREAIQQFHRGHAVIGYCPESRLAVPVYETAFALDRAMRERGCRDQARISIFATGSPGEWLGGDAIIPALRASLEKHDIGFISDFDADFITASEVWGTNAQRLPYDLLMLIPPFQGLYETQFSNITDRQHYVRVNRQMRSIQFERLYAAGDAVNLPGPKLAHMAVLQGAVAAANVVAEIEGREPDVRYDHQMTLVIDEGGEDSFFLHHNFREGGDSTIRQGRFWGWAKQMHERYWTRMHSLKPVE
jgi:sulfide:quinone oxidoreductase